MPEHTGVFVPGDRPDPVPVLQKTTPVRAKAIGKWALDGFVVGVALSILVGILGVILGVMYA